MEGAMKRRFGSNEERHLRRNRYEKKG